MKHKDVVKKVTAATLSAGFAMSLSGKAMASEPTHFSSQTLDKGYMQLANHEAGHDGEDGKCGSGKCSGGNCGSEMKKDAKDGKCGTGKCGANMNKESTEGKCGADHAKDADGKCGS